MQASVPTLRNADLTTKAEQGVWRPHVAQASVPLLRSMDLTTRLSRACGGPRLHRPLSPTEKQGLDCED